MGGSCPRWAFLFTRSKIMMMSISLDVNEILRIQYRIYKIVMPDCLYLQTKEKHMLIIFNGELTFEPPISDTVRDIILLQYNVSSSVLIQADI